MANNDQDKEYHPKLYDSDSDSDEHGVSSPPPPKVPRIDSDSDEEYHPKSYNSSNSEEDRVSLPSSSEVSRINSDSDEDDPVAPLQPNVTYYRCTLSSPTVEGLQVHEIRPYSVDPLQPDVAAHFHLAVSGNGELQLREIWRLNRGEYPRTGQRYPPILVTADEPHYMIQWLDDSGYVSYIDVNNNEVFL